ncbi:MAG: SMP-30/gluconolactonase/LRE family protein [Alphaproteobacteria bacterium]
MRLTSLVTRLLAGIALALALTWGAVRWRHGGGAPFPDRSGEPILPASALEKVADLPAPPGNVAVSREARIFLTFHPEGHPAIKVAEWKDGRAVAYPDLAFQMPQAEGAWFDTPLSLRVDSKNRLWVLDHGSHGFSVPRLLAFDLGLNHLEHEYWFPREIAGRGSMLNDFAISPDAKTIYIADSSIFRNSGAIIVYDVETKTARRVLDGDRSVQAMPYLMRVRGRDMQVLGAFALRPNVDSIALDRHGLWLYYGAVTSDVLWRIRAQDLDDPLLSPEQLSARVETFARKTMSDGITVDWEDNVYVTDPEHDAIHRIDRRGEQVTLLRDERLRWPDGIGFARDGMVYVTCSALHEIVLAGEKTVRRGAPYQLFRFPAGVLGAPGQ